MGGPLISDADPTGETSKSTSLVVRRLTFTRLAAGEESTMSALEDGILAEPYSRSNQPSPVQRCSTVDLGSGRNHCQLVRRVLARLCDQNDSSMIGGRESSGTWGGN
jgi:hypothetical protein